MADLLQLACRFVTTCAFLRVYTRKDAELVNMLCSQQACQQVCSNAVILSSCTKFVTRSQLVEKLLEQTCNKAVELIKLVASLLQACSNLVNKLGTTSASTSCQQVLLQVCCRFVTSCAFLRTV